MAVNELYIAVSGATPNENLTLILPQSYDLLKQLVYYALVANGHSTGADRRQAIEGNESRDVSSRVNATCKPGLCYPVSFEIEHAAWAVPGKGRTCGLREGHSLQLAARTLRLHRRPAEAGPGG